MTTALAISTKKGVEITETHYFEMEYEIRYSFNPDPESPKLVTVPNFQLQKKIHNIINGAVYDYCFKEGRGKNITEMEMDDLKKVAVILNDNRLMPLFVRVYNAGEHCYAKYYVHG